MKPSAETLTARDAVATRRQSKPMDKISKELSEIREKLNTLESYNIWLIRADQRFVLGQRVQFSERSHRRGYPSAKTRALKGVVKGMDSFAVRVLLDGRKHPRKYHHAFFNPVRGLKLF